MSDKRAAIMPPLLHQRLFNEATLHGAEEVLRRMPAEHSPELEHAIRLGVRQAVLYYAGGLDPSVAATPSSRTPESTRMSRWARRIRRPAGQASLQEVQAAVQNLAEHVGLAPGKGRVVFQVVTDVAR